MISHLGAMIPVAAGCAFAQALRGSDRVAINFIGDGGTSTGDFHEGLNMAAVWKLPLVLVVENNRFAFSTPTSQQYACERLADRGVGYGIAAETVDGNDPDAVAEVIERAVARARAGEGPTLVEAMLGRMKGHSEGDDSLKMVPEDDLERYRAEDPVPSYPERLADDGILDEVTRRRLDERARDLVERTLDRALDGPGPDPETAHRPVFAPLSAKSETSAESSGADPRQRRSRIRTSRRPPARPSPTSRRSTGRSPRRWSATRPSCCWARTSAPSRAPSGSPAASTSAGRSGCGTRRSPRAVPSASPSAPSLLGYRPVVEMQFADFVTCGFNQIVNVAAKLYYRWQVPCPITVRLPSGGGVGAGPFHSQNPEGWFTHVAGLKVVCPATAADARSLLKAAIRDPNPVLFFEHKYLYRRIKEALPATSHGEPASSGAPDDAAEPLDRWEGHASPGPAAISP